MLASSWRAALGARRRCCICQQLPLRLSRRQMISPSGFWPLRATSTWGASEGLARSACISRSGRPSSTARRSTGCRGRKAGSVSRGRCQPARVSSRQLSGPGGSGGAGRAEGGCRIPSMGALPVSRVAQLYRRQSWLRLGWGLAVLGVSWGAPAPRGCARWHYQPGWDAGPAPAGLHRSRGWRPAP